MPMQPSPMAESSRSLFPSLGFCTFFILFSVMLPSRPPVFVRIRGPDDHAIAGKLECAREIFSNQTADHRTLNMKSESVGAFINLVSAKRSFVAAQRILHRPSLRSRRRIAIHHLHRHVAVA